MITDQMNLDKLNRQFILEISQLLQELESTHIKKD
tara:strand:- start:223 stop:327 length:105 start_codon:yes stop_codon:yes gene_type:complete